MYMHTNTTHVYAGEKEVDDETAEFLEEAGIFNRRLPAPGMGEEAQECFLKQIDCHSAPKTRRQATPGPSSGGEIVQCGAADPVVVAADLMPSMQREANEARSFAGAIQVHPEANDTPDNLCRFASFMDKMYKKIQDLYVLCFLFVCFSFVFLVNPGTVFAWCCQIW